MRRSFSSPLTACLVLGAASLRAQSVQDMIRMVPGDAEGVAFAQRPAELESRVRALSARFKGPKEAPSGFLELQKDYGIDVAWLAPGPLVQATLKHAGRTEPHEVLLLPAASQKALVAHLKAVPEGGIHHYRHVKTMKVKTVKKGEPLAVEAVEKTPVTLYFARQGEVLVLCDDKVILGRVLKERSSLPADLAPVLDWAKDRSLAFVVSPKGLSELWKGFRKGVEEKAEEDSASPSAAMTKKMLQGFQGFGRDAEASVSHLAFGFDFDVDGGVGLRGRALFRPGSPLAAAVKAAGHPLASVPAGHYALSAGGPYPAAMSGLVQLVTGNALEQAEPEAKKAYLDAQAKVSAQVRTFAFALGAPAKTGDPLLSHVVMRVSVDDPAAYLQALEAQAAAQEKLGDLLPASTFQKGVLPGVASWTSRTTLSSAKLPPAQARMFTGLLFGGDALVMSGAQMDAHTFVMTFGEAEALRRTLDQAKAGGAGFPSAPEVKAADARVPADAAWRFYVDPKGVRDLVQVAMASFMPPDQATGLPEIAVVPPMELALSVDAGGAELAGVVAAETLEATARFFEAVKQAVPTPKGGPAPESASEPAAE